jgi:hypothetical protein
MYEKIIEFIRLPLYVVFLIFIVTGLLLFAPDSLTDRFQLNDFVEEYKMYFGITFLLSAGFLLANGIFIIINKIIKPKPSDRRTYLELFNELSNILLLPDWDKFYSYAKRGYVQEEFISNNKRFCKLLSSTVWPKKYICIKNNIILLNKKYNDFISIFMQHAELAKKYFKEIKFYAEIESGSDYDTDFKKYEVWSLQWKQALIDYVNTLNTLIILSNKYFLDEEVFPVTFRTKKTMD